eukprot:GFYU01016102.1.p1 GENE.GFYU01016102.1~~GFYU01016102.1.p1  ORF type:complete len:197 (+),score=32.47 GFYU01016102.1:136-726(+)
MESEHSRGNSGVNGLLTILVPRHLDRVDAVLQMIRLKFPQLRVMLRSQVRSMECVSDPALDVLVVDTIGELSDLYAGGDVAFVGGSLATSPIGGHNPIEACRHGCAVFMGVDNSSCKEVVDSLNRVHSDTISVVQSQEELTAGIAALVMGKEGSPHMGGDDCVRQRQIRAVDSVRQLEQDTLRQTLNAIGALISGH